MSLDCHRTSTHFRKPQTPHCSHEPWVPPTPTSGASLISKPPLTDSDLLYPPSFDRLPHDIVLRRQRARQDGKSKFTAVPSRFLNLTNDFEFAGWGSISYLKLTPEDICQGELAQNTFREQQVLGQFTASALVANDILGSVFYTLPSVVAVAGV